MFGSGRGGPGDRMEILRKVTQRVKTERDCN